MSNRLREEFDASALTHLGELLRVAVRMCGSRETAEDLVQETCLQAWRSFHRFEAGTNCRAWLFKIMMFCHSRQLRDQSRRPSTMGMEEAGEPAMLFEPPTPDIFDVERVRAAFDSVPAPFRTAMLLVDVEEFTYREAAEILSVPIGTVMSRLSRGRRLLRIELAKHAGQEQRKATS